MRSAEGQSFSLPVHARRSHPLTLDIAQRIVVTVLDQHVGKLGLCSVDALSSEDDRETPTVETLEVGEDIAHLS